MGIIGSAEHLIIRGVDMSDKEVKKRVIFVLAVSILGSIAVMLVPVLFRIL
jgi:hypothetical protein